MNAADRGMGLGLRALNRIAGLELLDRVGVRERAERLLYSASKNGFRAAGAAGRTFAPQKKLDRPARQAQGVRAELFDLTPTDEQQMMREAIGDFAMDRLRPARSRRGPGLCGPCRICWLRRTNSACPCWASRESSTGRSRSAPR